MASIQQDPSGNFHISFRFGGRKFKRSLKTSVPKQAQLKKLRLEETIALVEAGRIDLPPNSDVPTFLLSEGKLETKHVVQLRTLDDLSEQFFKSIRTDGLEEGTIKMMQIHVRTLQRHLGSRDTETVRLKTECKQTANCGTIGVSLLSRSPKQMSNIELTPDNSKFIESLVVTGKATSMGQALNMAVDLLKRKVEIAEAVQLGIKQADQGDLISADSVFERVERRAAEIEKSSREG